MKKIYFLFVLLLFFVSISCKKNGFCERGNNEIVTRELSLPAFQRIKVEGSAYVYLREDSVQKISVEMESNLIDDLNQTVNEGTWKIDFNKCVEERKRVNVYISLSSLSEVNLNGSGAIYSQTDFHGEDLVVRLNGSGTIDLSVFSGHIISSTSGSGNITLKGNCISLNSTLNGSGKHHFFGLQTQQTTSKINGSGVLEIKVQNTLDVNISGSGKVSYTGFPTVNSSLSGSGSITKVE